MAGVKPLLETLGALMPLAKVRRGPGELMGVYDRHIDDVPIDWLKRMPGNNIRSEENVRLLMKQIEEQGLLDPGIIHAGGQSKTAMLGEGNHRLEALRRMGYQSMPIRSWVGREYGSGKPGSDFSSDWILPPGKTGDARPSDIFRSLSDLLKGQR